MAGKYRLYFEIIFSISSENLKFMNKKYFWITWICILFLCLLSLFLLKKGVIDYGITLFSTPYFNLCKFGLGGKHGNGRQMYTWVHVDDVQE
jgi:uncharacterized membrane-anchored protein YitT (DUF2179 family)